MLCYNDLTIISTPTKLFSMEKLTHTYNISNEKKIACGKLKISSVEKTCHFFLQIFLAMAKKIKKNALIPLFSTNNQQCWKKLMHPFYKTATPDK